MVHFLWPGLPRDHSKDVFFWPILFSGGQPSPGHGVCLEDLDRAPLGSPPVQDLQHTSLYNEYCLQYTVYSIHNTVPQYRICNTLAYTLTTVYST